jgi:hypothetical protein
VHHPEKLFPFFVVKPSNRAHINYALTSIIVRQNKPSHGKTISGYDVFCLLVSQANHFNHVVLHFFSVVAHPLTRRSKGRFAQVHFLNPVLHQSFAAPVIVIHGQIAP